MSDFCTQCATPYRPEDRFCGKCGAPRPQGAAPASAPVGLGAAAPQPVSGAPIKRRKPIFSILLGLLLPIGMGVFFIVGLDSCGSVEGTMTVSGARGNFTFTPTDCHNTQPLTGRMGANVHGDGNNDGAVYVLGGLHGSEVEIEVPGSCRSSDGSNCNVFPVPRAQCTTFDATVTPTNTTVNDVRLVEGHVRLECTLEDGTQVRGNITFGGC